MKRHRIDPDYRGGLALGRRQLQILMFVAICGRTGATSFEMTEALGLPLATTYEMLVRLRNKGLVVSQKVQDGDKPRTIYVLTSDGETVAVAWQGFLRSIGPRLRRVLRLEDR